MRLAFAAPLAVSLSLACATQKADRAPRAEPPAAATQKPVAAAEQPAPPKQDLEAMARREVSQPLPTKAIAFPDDSFAADVEASTEPEVAREEGAVTVNFKIGSEGVANCYFYPEQIDVGGTAHRLLQLVSESVELRQVRPVAVSAIGTNPVVFLEGMYVGDGPAGKLLGMLKLAIHPTPQGSLMCIHDELGYSKTFRRVIEGLARTFKPKESESLAVRFADLATVKVGEVPVGFQRRRVIEAKDGGRIDEVLTAMLMPRSATDLMANDVSEVAIADKAGRISTLQFSSSSNGETELELSMERKEGNTYAYQGTHSGKKVSGTFKSKDKAGLPGEAYLENVVRTRLFDGKSAGLAIEQYEPSVDFAKPVEVVLRSSKASARGLSMTIGKLELACVADAAGMVERAEMSVGPTTLVQERVASVGTP